MDLDAHMRTLLRFKQDIEKVLHPHILEKLIALAESPAVATSDVDVVDLKKHVDELAETLTGVQRTMDELPTTIANALQEALKPMVGQLAAVEKLADQAVLDLLDWLARNREGIDLLLSIGEGDEEQPEEAQEHQPGGPDAPHPSDPETAQAGS